MGGIFDYAEPVLVGYLVDCIHVGALSIQADGHDRFGFGCDSRFDPGGVDVVGSGVDVHKNRSGAHQGDHLARGNESEWSGYDFVAGANAQRHHGDQQGIGAAAGGDAVFNADISGELVFELLDFGPHDVLAVMQHAVDALFQLGADGVLLGFKVNEVDRLLCRGCRKVLARSDCEIRVALAKRFIPRQQLDAAWRKAAQCANELLVLWVGAIEDGAFAGQGGEPMFVGGEDL